MNISAQSIKHVSVLFSFALVLTLSACAKKNDVARVEKEMNSLKVAFANFQKDASRTSSSSDSKKNLQEFNSRIYDIERRLSRVETQLASSSKQGQQSAQQKSSTTRNATESKSGGSKTEQNKAQDEKNQSKNKTTQNKGGQSNKTGTGKAGAKNTTAKKNK